MAKAKGQKKKIKENKPNLAHTVQISIHFSFTDISLSKMAHMANPRSVAKESMFCHSKDMNEL